MADGIEAEIEVFRKEGGGAQQAFFAYLGFRDLAANSAVAPLFDNGGGSPPSLFSADGQVAHFALGPCPAASHGVLASR